MPASAAVPQRTGLAIFLAAGLFVTPDIEWIRHSQFSPDDNGTWVLGMRAGAEF